MKLTKLLELDFLTFNDFLYNLMYIEESVYVSYLKEILYYFELRYEDISGYPYDADFIAKYYPDEVKDGSKGQQEIIAIFLNHTLTLLLAKHAIYPNKIYFDIKPEDSGHTYLYMCYIEIDNEMETKLLDLWETTSSMRALQGSDVSPLAEPTIIDAYVLRKNDVLVKFNEVLQEATYFETSLSTHLNEAEHLVHIDFGSPQYNYRNFAWLMSLVDTNMLVVDEKFRLSPHYNHVENSARLRILPILEKLKREHSIFAETNNISVNENYILRVVKCNYPGTQLENESFPFYLTNVSPFRAKE